MIKRVLLVSSLLALAAVSNAFDLYNSYDSATSTARSATATGSKPRSTMGNVITTAGSGDYSISELDFTVVNFGTASFPTVLVNVNLFETVSTSAATYFSNSVFNTTYSANVNLDPGYYTSLVATPVGLKLKGSHTYGLVLTYMDSTGKATSDLTSIISYGPALAAGTTGGYYRDADGNGVISSGEGRTLGNTNESLDFKLVGTAVPEPATYAVFGLGLVGLVARRRK